MIRIIIKVDHYGPDGNAMSPSWRTVDIDNERVEKMLIPPSSYATCAIVGCERTPDTDVK
jgi:hypothetical protein